MTERHLHFNSSQVASMDSSSEPLHKDYGHDELREKIWRLDTRNKELTAEIDSLRANLVECETMIFAMQGPHEVTDQAIMNEYVKIHKAIDTWVDSAMDHIPPGHFNKIYRRLLTDENEKSMFTDLGFTPSSREILGRFESSDCFVLSLLIQRHLDKIFKDEYPVGITGRVRTFVSHTQRTMLKPPLARDKDSVAKWRAETLRAIMADSKFGRKHAEGSKYYLELAERSLRRWLQKLLESKVIDKYLDRFDREIHTPAIKLHQILRTSIRQYRFLSEPSTRGLSLTTDQMHDLFRLKNVNTWGPVRRRTSTGESFRFLYCLHPSLIRVGTDGNEDMALVKPVVVVVPQQSHYESRNANFRGIAGPEAGNMFNLEEDQPLEDSSSSDTKDTDSEVSSSSETDDQEQEITQNLMPSAMQEHRDNAFFDRFSMQQDPRQPETMWQVINGRRVIISGARIGSNIRGFLDSPRKAMTS